MKKFRVCLLALILVSGLVLPAAVASAADTGFLYPTQYATGSTGNTASQPDRALADDVATGSTDDGNCALFKSYNPGTPGGSLPDSEWYSAFGFGIPAGATIDAIEVVVSGYQWGPWTGLHFFVRLSGDGGASWSNSGITGQLTSSDATYTLSGAGPNWGLTWTPDMLSDANFRLEVQPGGPLLAGEHWKLDSVKVKVYYTVATCSCPWVGDTAWSAGEEYGHNWATYSGYQSATPVTLWAGQTLDAGTVAFSTVAGGEVTITITLNSGWRFKDVPENVKIQGYIGAPSGRPVPGSFANKATATGSPFTITVPPASFYGVHVDVEWHNCTCP